MRMNRAMIAACSLLCAIPASCGKSRVPSAPEEPPEADADGIANAGGKAGAGAGASAGAGSNAGAGAGSAGTPGVAGSSAGAAGAQPPEPTCGLLWYQCGDACGQLIQGASRTFGECVGDCGFTLALRPAFVLDDGGCVGVFASLTVENTEGGRRSYEGTLTGAAWERLAQLSIDLEAARFAISPVSGCPDCADGGTGTIVIRGVDQLTQTFAYEYGNPPAELRVAHDFLQRLIDELLACQGPLLESCSILEIDPDPDTPPDVTECAFVYSSGTSAVSCTMPVDAERPCALAVECLCQSQVLEGAPVNVDACTASWLTPRGAITFTDVCTPGQTDMTPTLASALASFASYYGATVTTNPECDDVSAYF